MNKDETEFQIKVFSFIVLIIVFVAFLVEKGVLR